MSLALALSQLSPEDKKVIIGGVIGLAQSAPVVALVGVGTLVLSWNLEHLALQKVDSGLRRPNGSVIWKYSIRRLTTRETSNLDDPNLTPFAPPIQSMVARAADSATDVVEATSQLAAKQVEGVGQKGAIQQFIEFFLGSA